MSTVNYPMRILSVSIDFNRDVVFIVTLREDNSELRCIVTRQQIIDDRMPFALSHLRDLLMPKLRSEYLYSWNEADFYNFDFYETAKKAQISVTSEDVAYYEAITDEALVKMVSGENR